MNLADLQLKNSAALSRLCGTLNIDTESDNFLILAEMLLEVGGMAVTSLLLGGSFVCFKDGKLLNTAYLVEIIKRLAL